MPTVIEPVGLRKLLLAAAAILICSRVLGAAGDPTASAKPTEADIIKNAQPGDWRLLNPEDTLVMDVSGKQVVIELAPRFAPRHVDNIRRLARNGYYSRSAIVRVQDNYVTQWADPNDEDPARALPLGDARAELPAEFAISLRGLAIDRLKDPDGWAPVTGWLDGMPVAADPAIDKAWIAHCYGVIGSARGNAPDNSNATSLYAIIGQSPRRLDRNITVVGRVVQGMDALSALPRGPAPMGFYEQPAQRIALGRVQLMADMAPAERPALEVLRTETATWTALVEATRNPPAAWFAFRPGHTNICNRGIPVRPAGGVKP